MGVLERVNEGQCQWALVRVNGGIEQWGLNGGIEKKSMKRALVRVNAVLKRGQGGLEKGQVRQGLGLGQTGVWLWVRQGCGRGSDRRLFYRVVSSTLQGCKLYLAGLQALPYRVASSTLQGCKLYLAGL